MTQKVGSDNSDDFDEEEIKDNVFRKTNFSKCIFLGRMFETVFWMLEQPVNNKGCSSIQFLLGEFYQGWVLESFIKFLSD